MLCPAELRGRFEIFSGDSRLAKRLRCRNRGEFHSLAYHCRASAVAGQIRNLATSPARPFAAVGALFPRTLCDDRVGGSD